MTNIDHLVYAVPNLEEGITSIQKLFGVSPNYGGRHLTKGTHNALIGLGESCYLELIAIDHENKQVTTNRWMGVDHIHQPTLCRWALATSSIQEDLKLLGKIKPERGQLEAGSRKKSDGSMLKWQLSLPLTSPAVDICPFLIDWSGSTHPSESLTNSCTLISLKATHPQAERYLSLYQKLGIDIEIIKANDISLIATFDTPNGVITLS